MVWSVLYIVVYYIVQHYIECMYVCIVGFKVGAGVLRAQVGGWRQAGVEPAAAANRSGTCGSGK